MKGIKKDVYKVKGGAPGFYNSDPQSDEMSLIEIMLL
jgi:hypothetical protein